LRPVYASNGQDARIAQLSLMQADWTDDAATKLRALLEVVRLRERLGDTAGAFDVQLQALRHAATEPELAQVVADTERLAGELERNAELIDAFIQVAPDVLDADIQRGMYFDIADLARGIRQDNELAREYYQKVLDSSPEDRRALTALESIYRDQNKQEQLVEILLRQADIADDVEEKVNELVEAAGIYASLKRPDDAIQTWEQVLLIAPERADAIYALEGLYSQQGRWQDVVDLYERRLGFVTSIDEAAIENYAAALSGNQRQPHALAVLESYLNDPDARVLAADVLEPIYVGQQRWTDLVRVYSAKLEGAVDPDERLRLTRFLARLHEEQLEDFESALKWYARVFREAPGDHTVREQLQRLGGIVESWGFVAQTYQTYLDDESGESDEIREVAVAAATIYDRRLNQVELAYAAYRRALAIDPPEPVEGAPRQPDARALVSRVEDMLIRSQRWSELLTIYDDVIARADEDLRREALFKRARLLEDGLQDQVRAIEGWREVILITEDGGSSVIEHTYREAVGELERLYRTRGQYAELVDLYEARVSRARDAAAFVEVAELRLRLADVYENNLNDLTAALDQYEEVINAGQLWDRAVRSFRLFS
jgi:tetratricopeptide (TPR) repeat protein